MTEGSDERLIYHHAPFNEAQSLSQNRDTARQGGGSFYISPDPLLPALLHLRALYSPPPPGRREERAMISICRGVLAYGLPSSHRPVPSHSLIVRSTIRNRFAGHPRRFVKLIVCPIRGGGAVSASSSRRRRFRYSPRLAVLRSSPRPFDTGDGAMMFSSCQATDSIDGGWRRRSISGGLLFRYDPVLVRLRRSVLLVVCPIRGTGRGLVCCPSSRCLSVSRSCRWCSER